MFESNNHSVWQIRWKDVTPEVFAEVEGLLRQYYGVNTVTSIEQVDEWERASNNYRVVCNIAGDAEYTLVRRHIISRSGEIQAATEVMAYLRQLGVKVPSVIQSDDGLSVILLNGIHWQAFAYVAGDHFRGNKSQLVQAASGIAELHQSFLSFPHKEVVAHIDTVIGPLRADYWDDVPQLPGANPFETMLHDRHVFVQEKTRETMETLAVIQEQEEIIHGDIHPQNFLFQDDALAAIIDFGTMARADQMNDIAMACHRLVRQYIVHTGRAWEDLLVGGIRLFLDSYTAVHPLGEVQMRLLPVFADALLLRKMAHNFGLYRTGRRTWEEALSQWERFFLFMEEIDAIRTVII